MKESLSVEFGDLPEKLSAQHARRGVCKYYNMQASFGQTKGGLFMYPKSRDQLEEVSSELEDIVSLFHLISAALYKDSTFGRDGSNAMGYLAKMITMQIERIDRVTVAERRADK